MRLGFCKHYAGTDKRCYAGVVLSEVARPLTADEVEWYKQNYPQSPITKDSGIFKRIPCCARNDVHTCDQYCEPTAAEIAEYEAETDNYRATFMQRMQIVRPAIKAHIKENGWEKRSVASTIPCPICETGTVNYTYAGNYNRHIHAACTTENCVAWIE